MGRPVHLGFTSFAASAVRELLGAPEPDLAAYARVFGAYEMACTAERGFTRKSAESLLDMCPPTLRLLPRVPDTDVAGWTDAAAPILESSSCGPLFLPWSGPWSPNSEVQLDRTLATLWDRLPARGRVAVEFRDPSWFRGDALRLLEEQGAALVWSTLAGLVPYKLTSDFLYIRLTGVQNRRTPDEVSALVDRVRARLGDTRPLHVISTLPGQAYGVAALRRFASAVGRPLTAERGGRGQLTLEGFARGSGLAVPAA